MKYRDLYLDNYYVKNIAIQGLDDLETFLKGQLSQLTTERFCIGLLSDSDEVLLWTDGALMSQMGVREVTIPLVEITRLIALMEPHKLFMAHNHPSGVTHISENDVVTTQKVKDLCELLGVQFEGHYLVAGDSVRNVEGEDALPINDMQRHIERGQSYVNR